MTPKQPLTAERAREVLDYDPETGKITCRVTRGRSAKGRLIGTKKPNGYISMVVDGRRYYAHRVAWLIVHGQWPTATVDHYNGVRDDNRLDNLREATQSLNLQNQRRPHSNNTSGYLGVTWYTPANAFRSRINIKGKDIHLGLFADPAAAHAAYLAAKRQLHPGSTI